MEINGKTFNIVDPNREKSIFDLNSEFIKQLEIMKLKLEIRPRKSNMMQAQTGMIQDFMSEDKPKQLYVPVNGSYK